MLQGIRQEKAERDMLKSKNIGMLRKAIRTLQEIPLVLSLFVLLNYILDIFIIDIDRFICPVFGFSIYVLIRLYSISRKMFVPRWSRSLYIALIFIVSVELMDEIFGFSLRFIEFQQYVFLMFIVGCISSLVTYIYDKFRK